MPTVPSRLPRSLGVFCFVLFSAILLAGCQPGSDAAQRVAVVDLDLLAERVGSGAEMLQQLEALATSEQARWQQRQVEIKEELAAHPARQEGQDQPDAGYLELATEREAELRNALSESRERVNNLKLQLVAEFKGQAEIYVKQVAESSGIGLVHIKQPGMLFIHTSTDITEQVAQAWLAKPPHQGDKS